MNVSAALQRGETNMAFREITKVAEQGGYFEAEAREILARADHGVLATAGEDGWPYAVPLNHVLIGDALYVHCALEGHKLENIAHEEKVSYCAVASADSRAARSFRLMYESAIVFGRASLVTDGDESRRALKLLTERFCGQGEEQEERFEKHLEQNENGQPHGGDPHSDRSDYGQSPARHIGLERVSKASGKKAGLAESRRVQRTADFAEP